MSKLEPGMVVMVYRNFAARQSPMGRAELLERITGGPLPRGGQLEHWRIRYLDPPEQGATRNNARPESVTIRTDETDLRPGAKPPPEDHGHRVRC